MSAIDELFARHRAFSSAPLPTPTREPTARPQLQVVVLTCMDTRIDINEALGIRRGDAHVLRNAGGLVTDDALRSLIVSQRLLGTREVMVVMHSECGMQGLNGVELAGRLEAESQQAVPFAFAGFDDLDAELRAGVERLRACPWLPHRESIRGFVHDVTTHRIVERIPAQPPP